MGTIRIRTRPRAEVEAAWRAEREKSREGAIEAPLPANVRAITEIAGWRLLGYGQVRRFLIPPVPYAEGARLDWIRRRIEQLNNASEKQQASAEMHAEYVALCREVTEIAHRLVRPLRYRNRFIVGFFARLFWRLQRNPFRHASEAEIGGLLGFFSMCRTMSSVRLP